MKKINKNFEFGAASIFVVIFFTLLIGVITVSFIRIANNDQQQALNNDLSQSAYDAAQAGVEDAKKRIIDCLGDDGCKADMESQNIFNGEGCKDGADKDNSTVKVGEGEGESQKYTCVNITYLTDEVSETLASLESTVYPLDGIGDWEKVGVSWFTKDDVGDDVPAGQEVSFFSSPEKLPKQNEASPTTPAVLRAQIIAMPKADGAVDLDKINHQTKAVFLYPVKTIADPAVSFSDLGGPEPADNSQTGGSYTIKPHRQAVDNKALIKTQCKDKFTADGHICEASLTGFNPEGYNYWLILTPYYAAKTSIKVELLTGSDDVVTFNGIQPEIDATGQAGDVFRRISTKVNLNGAAGSNSKIGTSFNVAGDICKNFGLSNDKVYPGGSDCPLVPDGDD